jgi:outer membrane protein W
MKKLVVLAGALALTGASFAQKATTDAPFSLEGQFGFNASSLSFDAPAIRFRYFVTENIAARVTLGMDNSSETFNYFEVDSNNSGGSGTEVNKLKGWSLAIGGEYHFEGTEKLSPYAGLDIVLGGGSSTNEWTNYDGFGYQNNFSREITAKTSSIGVNLVAGADYYFAENFYLGLELGLGFNSMTVKEGEDVITNGGATSTTISEEEKYTSLGNNVVGQFRLGWRF